MCCDVHRQGLANDSLKLIQSILHCAQTFESCLDFAEKEAVLKVTAGKVQLNPTCEDSHWETLLMVASGIQCAGAESRKLEPHVSPPHGHGVLQVQ